MSDFCEGAAPDVITEAAIPLAPGVPVGEAAHLVEAPAVPGLCNELYLQPRFTISVKALSGKTT